MAKTDALQGSLDLLVVKILSRRPRLHGYAIMAAIASTSGVRAPGSRNGEGIGFSMDSDHSRQNRGHTVSRESLFSLRGRVPSRGLVTAV